VCALAVAHVNNLSHVRVYVGKYEVSAPCRTTTFKGWWKDSLDGTIETVKFVKSRSQKDAGIRLIENFALCRNNVTGHAGGP